MILYAIILDKLNANIRQREKKRERQLNKSIHSYLYFIYILSNQEFKLL